MDFPGKYYKTLLFWLKIIGQSPYQERWTAMISKTIIYSVLCTDYFVQVSTFATFDMNLDLVIELVPLHVTTVTLIFAMTYIYRHMNLLEALLEKIKADWAREQSEEELNFKKYYAYIGYLISYYPFYAALIGLVFFYFPICTFATQILDHIKPLNESRKPHLTFHLQFFMDEEENYYLILMHEYVTLMVVFTTYMVNQSLYLVMVLQCFGLFESLGYRFQQLASVPELDDEFSQIEIEDALTCKMKLREQAEVLVYNRVLTSIDLHREAIEFFKCFQKFYQPILTALVIAFFMIMCPTLIKVTTTQLIDYQYIFFFAAQIIFVSGNTFIGQKLIDKSHDIYVQAYDRQWYKDPLPAQKLLLFMLRRSLKPCELTAYNIISLNNEAIRMYVQTIFSYFTVLRQVR